MVNIILIGGELTSKVENYLSKTDSINVLYSYNTLQMGIRNILDNFIDVQKLVYIYTDTSQPFAQDMACLLKLLERVRGNGLSRSVFDIEEVSLYYKDTPEINKNLGHFNQVMNKSGYKSYTLYPSKTTFEFKYLEESILGQSTLYNKKPKRVNVYRVERGSEIKNVIEPESGNKHEYIDPFTINTNDDYDEYKENVRQSETGTLYSDNEKEQLINQDKIPNLDIPIINMDDSYLKKNVYIFSGDRKSGVSTSNTLFIKSALAEDRTITLIDLTGSGDTETNIRLLGIPFSIYTIQNLIDNSENLNVDNFQIIKCNYLKRDIRMDYLRYILDYSNKITSDIVIIECYNDLLDEVVDTVGMNINRVLYHVETIKRNLDKVSNRMNTLADRVNLFIVPAQISNELRVIPLVGKHRETIQEVRERFRKNIVVLEPVSTKDLDGSLYNRVLRFKG